MNSFSEGDALQRRTIALLGGLAHLGWVRDARSGINGGACDLDPKRALIRAGGEYAEHHSQIQASDLLALVDAERRIDPRHFCHDSADRSPVRCWVRGRGMVTGDAYVVPAQAVFLGWDPPPEEPRLWFQTSVGTAAHHSANIAETSALAEVIERDTLIRGWQTGDISFRELTPMLVEALPAEFLRWLASHHVVVTVVRVDDIVPDLVLAMLSRADGGNLTCGAAIRPDTQEAIRHAVLEALAVRVALSSSHPPARLETHHRDRGLLAARNGPDHVGFVTERTTPGGETRKGPTGLAPLLALAQDRFGHEPIAISLPEIDGHLVQRVVCPGSRVFESIRSTDPLPCPIA